MLPVLVRGFDESIGVLNFKLSIKFIPKETSLEIGNELLETGRDWKLEDKVIAFGADNCPTNFGNVLRRGDNNVFARLKRNLGRSIIGIGCAAHIIHNAFDIACEQLPADIEPIVVNIYKHFHIHTLRNENLKELCAEAEVEYMKLTNHSGTRFLSLLPAVSRVNLFWKILWFILFKFYVFFFSTDNQNVQSAQSVL